MPAKRAIMDTHLSNLIMERSRAVLFQQEGNEE
jgi:hypothetical protein